MFETARASGRTVWKFYLVPGLFIGGIKFASVFTWFFYHSIAATIGLVDSNYAAGDIIGILTMGFVGIFLAIIGWPVLVYNLLTGSASLPAALFYPWITNL